MKTQWRRRKGLPELLVPVLLLLLLLPESSWAVQQHGGTEGLISHQVGHLLFICGMLYVFLRLRRFSARSAGWSEFRLFVTLIILWNLLTFYGHWHHELVDPDKFMKVNGRTTGFHVSTPMDALFFLSRLDHLLLLPAFLCLLMALLRWSKA
ncbi:MAG: hypothetical protein Kow0089_15630 [Desulfobulbaceae bacterium]